MTAPARILVTDGDTRAALAMTRGLGRAGFDVCVSEPRGGSLAGTSRYCASRHEQAALRDGPSALAESLVRVVETTRADLVVGVTDPTLTVLHDLAARIAPARLAPPPRDLYVAASDKVRLAQVASEIGIPVPAGIAVAGGKVPPPEALAALGTPLVVRPAVSWRIRAGAWIRGMVSYEADHAALARRAAHDPALEAPYLVQRFVPGQGCGIFILAAEGNLVRVFAHRRLREKPPEGGVSTLCEAVDPDAEIVESARRFVAALGWHGLAMLEFRRSASDGKAYLIEVNARPWGSLALASAAGVDFPADLAAIAFSQRVPRDDGYRSGVRLRWWWGDVDHFYLREKARGSRGKTAMLKSLLRAAVAGPWPDAWDTARLDDPIPFAVETLRWMRA